MTDPLPWVVHQWPDGTELHARPGFDADAFDVLHDTCHELVARALGLPRSPTLQRAATGQSLDDDLVRLEESAVLAVQAFARALSSTSSPVPPDAPEGVTTTMNAQRSSTDSGA